MNLITKQVQVVELLKDPVQNIYMTASELTIEDIQIIASRYNLGPDCSLEYAKEWGYACISINKEVWDVTTDFVEDAGDAIGGFFSVLFA